MNKNINSAVAGFAGLIEQVKSQQGLWTNHVNSLARLDSKNICEVIRAAFFAQALANSQSVCNFFGEKIVVDISEFNDKFKEMKQVYQQIDYNNKLNLSVYLMETNVVLILDWDCNLVRWNIFSLLEAQSKEIKNLLQNLGYGSVRFEQMETE